jgi:hypothetical protein
MSRPRDRLIGWTYDDKRQEIRTPSGRIITLRAIAQRMQDDIRCRYDFGGAWEGWKMRGDRLMPPRSGKNGPALKPNTAPEFARWIADARGQPAADARRPRLYLVK